MADTPVNKAQLRDLIGVSSPTLDRWIARFDGFPVITRGTNGREWEFDASAVLAYLRARKADEAATNAARDEQLAQLVLPLDPPTAPAGVLSFAEQLKAAQLRKLQREEMEREGLLVSASAMRQVMADAFAKQRRLLDGALHQECIELSLPDLIYRRLATCIENASRAWVAEMRTRAPIAPEQQDAAD